MKGKLTKLQRSTLNVGLSVLLGIALLLCSSGLPVEVWAVTTSSNKSVTVPANVPWTDTGIDVTPGDKLHITAKGTVDFADKTGVAPAGAERGWKDTILALSVASAGRGALVGRVGSDPAALPFFIGADGTVTVPVAGRLFLGVNQGEFSKPTSGKFQVEIQRTPATTQVANGAAAVATKYDFQPVFATLAKQLPNRVTDKPEGGNPGDLVNFVFVGTQDQVTNALKAAGWVVADKTDQDAVVSALLATLQKNVYVTVPMSILYLFGRPQDFGYENAQAVEVANQRNHFRIWKAPFEGPQKQTLWAGAGTHDIGIERDKRSANAITHKIDPDVDKERDFIGATLQQAGRVEAMSYMDRPNGVKETHTATGGEIKSDGRVLVIVLKPVQAAK
ncbi:MAG: LssY C-terminal domain-containing protein [Candidatus Korobacteraceae bacterium]